jgi:hypothetical protein
LVPVRVTRLTAAPAERPYSAEKLLVSTVISWMAASGRAVKIVWRPQASSAVPPSTVKVVCRRPPPLTTKRVSLKKTSPVVRAGRTAESSSGSEVSLRLTSGTFSIWAASKRSPSWGESERTPSAVP